MTAHRPAGRDIRLIERVIDPAPTDGVVPRCRAGTKVPAKSRIAAAARFLRRATATPWRGGARDGAPCSLAPSARTAAIAMWSARPAARAGEASERGSCEERERQSERRHHEADERFNPHVPMARTERRTAGSAGRAIPDWLRGRRPGAPTDGCDRDSRNHTHQGVRTRALRHTGDKMGFNPAR